MEQINSEEFSSVQFDCITWCCNLYDWLNDHDTMSSLEKENQTVVWILFGIKESEHYVIFCLNKA